MSKVDLSSKDTEEEFYEDFSGWKISDEELEAMLVHARKTSDIRLRRLVKQNQYFRWLIPKLVELAAMQDEENIFVELGRAACKTTINKQS